MGMIQMDGRWKCHVCGCSTIEEHHKEWARNPDNHHDGIWTTRREREQDPQLAGRCGHGGPAVWIGDKDWNTCHGCHTDIDDKGREALDEFRKAQAAAWESGNFVIYEEIGVCIINDYAVAKIVVDDKKELAIIRIET
jgi:hypothetical protein